MVNTTIKLDVVRIVFLCELTLRAEVCVAHKDIIHIIRKLIQFFVHGFPI